MLVFSILSNFKKELKKFFLFLFLFNFQIIFFEQFFLDDLPPPPEPTEYVHCLPGSSFPPPPEELPPPPSPVSSSYSELRRATYQNDYSSGNYPNDIYGPSSQSSSTYESIYEPINPRPPSQLSCNYSMYSGYGSATMTQPQGKVSPVKEVRK